MKADTGLATRFGNPSRYNDVEAYPFFYNFIAYPYAAAVYNDATGITESSAAGAEGPDGLAIAAGGFLDVPIVMDPDTAFHLLYIKYGAFNPSPQATLGVYLTGSRSRLIGPQSFTGNPFTALANQQDFYWRYLDVSVYMVSSGGRDLYGGFQRSPTDPGKYELPIPLLSLQGAADGLGCVRTAFQLPRQATVRLRFINRFSSTLNLYGHLFGYKITI